jgi:general secretion pathway protein G
MVKSRKRSSRKGFTLIEILAVLIILGLLAALIVPNIVSRVSESRIETTKLQMKAIKNALDQYKLDNGFYPTTAQGLKALVEKPKIEPIPKNWHQYMEKVPKDAWGNDFIYISPAPNGKPYDLKSKGPDGIEGTKDDIDIWDIQ